MDDTTVALVAGALILLYLAVVETLALVRAGDVVEAILAVEAREADRRRSAELEAGKASMDALGKSANR